MKRRVLRLGWVVGCAGTILAGCQSLHPLGLRSRDDPSATRLITPGKLPESEPEMPEGTKGFFKPSRLHGALSDEGAEVERHLGIP
jgi:hypothetical protein